MLTVQRCNAEQRKQKRAQRGYSAGIVARGRQRGVAGAREREKGRRSRTVETEGGTDHFVAYAVRHQQQVAGVA